MNGDIDYTPDWDYHQKAWKVKRLSWLILLLLLLAALFGLLGVGPISKKIKTNSKGDFRVEYYNLLRSRKEVRFDFNLKTQPNDSLCMLALSTDFLDDVAIERISPSPLRTLLSKDYLKYYFRLSHPGDETTISFQVRPENFGRKELRVKDHNEKETIHINLFVYP